VAATWTYDRLRRAAEHDKRWTTLESKDRHQLFEDYMAPLTKQLQSELKHKKERLLELLHVIAVSHLTQWPEVRQQLDEHVEFQALQVSSGVAEEVFRLYVEAALETEAKERLRQEEIRKHREEEESERRTREAENKRRGETMQAEVSKWTVGKSRDQSVTRPLVVIMGDLFTSHKMGYDEVAALIAHDKRYAALRVTDETQRQVFAELRQKLSQDVRDRLRDVYRALPLTVSTSWAHVQKHFAADVVLQEAGADMGKEVFDSEYEQVVQQAQQALRDLMHEVGVVTKVHRLSISEFKDLLRHDERYRALSDLRADRDAMIERFLERSREGHSQDKSHKHKRSRHN